MIGQTLTIARREFAALFSTALGPLFLAVFIAAAGGLTFFAGRFYARGQADLVAFFAFHPWLYLVLMPALGMRLWAEESRSGTIEALMTAPVGLGAAVVGKFLAAWAFAALALALTFPLWLTVAWLGAPDHGVILASYLGSLLMGGSFLAISAVASALARNQVVAFVVGVTVSAVAVLLGLEGVLSALVDVAPGWSVAVARALSPTSHFVSITRGVVELRDLFWSLSFIVLMLVLNAQILELRRGR